MVDYTKIADEDLLIMLEMDNDRAFTELYERYWPALWRFASNSMKDRDDAMDIVQDVFTFLWDKRGRLQVYGSFHAFIYKVTLHKVLDRLHKSKQADPFLAMLQKQLEAGENSTEHWIFEKELVRSFERGMARIPQKARKVFEMSREGGLSHQQISEQLGISRETVKSQIKVALRIIRKGLSMIVLFFF